MIGKKFLVDGKRTACLKQICLLVIWRVSNRKTLSGETFGFLEKCLLSIFKFDALSNFLFVCLFFSTSWLILNQLSLNVLLFSCDPIGEPCLSDPGYSSRTVIIIRELKWQRRQRRRGWEKSNNFRLTKRQLCMCIALFVLSLRSQYDYNLKVPNFTFCQGRELKTITLFFFSWNLIQSFRIQLQTNFLTFDKLNELE